MVSGEIYCKLLVACEGALDVRRAEEWLPATSPFGDRPSVAWASAICRTHYGGILVVAGRWEEAEHELEEALRLYDISYRALRAAALARLAELRVRQGRLSESRELLSGRAYGRLRGAPVGTNGVAVCGGRRRACCGVHRLGAGARRTPQPVCSRCRRSRC